jgi:hypothetical protein
MALTKIKTDALADNAVTAVKIADNAVDLAEMAHGTDGELITYDAAGAPANVAVGTSGHILTSGGVGVAPTFQAAAAGGADTALSNLTSTGKQLTPVAWINFRSTGSLTILDSYNISSILDQGTGENHVYIDTDPSSQYFVPSGGVNNTHGSASFYIDSTTGVRVNVSVSGSLVDSANVYVLIFGDH